MALAVHELSPAQIINHPRTEVLTINGVYCIFFVDDTDKIITIPVDGEDFTGTNIVDGKWEADIDDRQIVPITPDMVTITSGADHSNLGIEQMVKEITEETGLVLKPDRLFSLPFEQTRTIQFRQNKVIQILGTGFSANLTTMEVDQLINFIETTRLFNTELTIGTPQELLASDKKFRPFARSLLYTLSQEEDIF